MLAKLLLLSQSVGRNGIVEGRQLVINVEKSNLAGHYLNGWLAGPVAQPNVAGKIKCGWYPDTTDTMIIQPCVYW